MRRIEPHRVVLAALYLAALAVVVRVVAAGASYYATPLAERPRHPGYWTFKPGGEVGHALGVAGAALMVLMLLYTVRKRWRPLAKAGRMRAWLDFHIFCGVVGPVLVVLHTSFKFGGLVALSFWSMVAVASSGVLGRYLYQQIPRTRAGDELTLAQVAAEVEALEVRLRDEVGLAPEHLERLRRLTAGGAGPDAGLAVLLLRLPFDGLSLRWRLWAFGRRLTEVPRRLRRRAVALAHRRAVLARRLLLWRRLQQLFHYWHVVHKPFAVVMYLFLAVHVVVVSLAGYGWAGR